MVLRDSNLTHRMFGRVREDLQILGLLEDRSSYLSPTGT